MLDVVGNSNSWEVLELVLMRFEFIDCALLHVATSGSVPS